MTKHDDRDALLATASLSGLAGYKAYIDLGGTRSYDGWEVKRRRANATTPMAREPILPFSPNPVGVPADFVGFNIGFWDIETTFSTQPIVLYAAIADMFGNIREFRKGDDITNDRDLVERLAVAVREYDIIVDWNGARFDRPVMDGRLAFHGLPRLDPNMAIDLMYQASGSRMRIGRRSLQSVSEYFDVPNRKTPLSVRIWDRAMSGDPEAYEKIAEHCNADVLVLRDVFRTLKRNLRSVHRAS